MGGGGSTRYKQRVIYQIGQQFGGGRAIHYRGVRTHGAHHNGKREKCDARQPQSPIMRVNISRANTGGGGREIRREAFGKEEFEIYDDARGWRRRKLLCKRRAAAAHALLRL